MATETRKLPPALVKNATKLATTRKRNLRAAARDDLALIKRKQSLIVQSFYEIGQALARLQGKGVPEALGYASFAELVDGELGMGAPRAHQLVAIATQVRERDALRWGQEKSAALLELTRATSNADTPASLARGTLKLTSGRSIDVDSASVREIRIAAREERQARTGRAKPRRGVTTTESERAQAKAIEDELHAKGVKSARVRAMAHAGGIARLRIEGVPMDLIPLLRRAL